MTTILQASPADLAADRALVASRIAGATGLVQRHQAGIRGGQRRHWQDISPPKPKRTGKFTLVSDSVTVTFDVTEANVTVLMKPGHGAFP